MTPSIVFSEGEWIYEEALRLDPNFNPVKESYKARLALWQQAPGINLLDTGQRKPWLPRHRSCSFAKNPCPLLPGWYTLKKWPVPLGSALLLVER